MFNKKTHYVTVVVNFTSVFSTFFLVQFYKSSYVECRYLLLASFKCLFCALPWKYSNFILKTIDNVPGFAMEGHISRNYIVLLYWNCDYVSYTFTGRLDSCNLTKESCSDVATVLSSKSSCLEELDMSNNNIQDSGVWCLASQLKLSHCKLKTLR